MNNKNNAMHELKLNKNNAMHELKLLEKKVEDLRKAIEDIDRDKVWPQQGDKIWGIYNSGNSFYTHHSYYLLCR